MTRQNREIWTTRRLLDWTTQYLQAKEVDSPRLSAEMLLGHVLEVGRLNLYLDLDRPASELERAAFRDLVERAARHEPVDYLVGRCPFYSLIFTVNRDVLIPRPSTEALVEHVIRHSRRTPGFHKPRIADIGTGSGAIAVTLAKNLPDCHIVATDISLQALAVAQRNAAELGVENRIEFLEGRLFDPLAQERFHYLISNPPYISDDEWKQVHTNIREYEPHTALRAGPDGLLYLRPLIQQAHQFLETPGQLVLEISSSQKAAVLELSQESEDLKNAYVLSDHEGHDRVLVADMSP